jgi:dTDP-4-amino-4,6-dideoxy-D-galactose acyltransferase
VRLVERLDWDSAFFGVGVGRVLDDVDATDIAEAVAEGRQEGLDCMYLLASADDDELVAAAEEQGFRVRGIRTELQRPVLGHPAGTEGLRLGGEDDLEKIAPIARERFRTTRFFNDPNFPRERSAELYVEWLRRGLSGDPERQTLVAVDDRGFVTCHFDAARSFGTIELIAVSGSASGRGLGRSLVAGAGSMFVEHSLRHARVVTQGDNLEAQRLYQACGYRTTKMGLWLHIWWPSESAGD